LGTLFNEKGTLTTDLTKSVTNLGTLDGGFHFAIVPAWRASFFGGGSLWSGRCQFPFRREMIIRHRLRLDQHGFAVFNVGDDAEISDARGIHFIQLNFSIFAQRCMICVF
jgi:hypothetical protein